MVSDGGRTKTASDTYQKLSQLEHVLKRPDSYIGSVERTEMQMWVSDATSQMQYKQIEIVPGLYKIFDEILVNAADNKVRDPAMKNIKVDIDVVNNTISVYNDGKGIPIEKHDKEKIYIPELIFGNLLTSSNYDDEEQKVTGGRNGFGAKLCNIFSSNFVLETAERRKLYRQEWHDNMTRVDPPEITQNPTGKSYTKVTFQPDLKRFGMTSLDDDLVGVLRRRVWDIAGTTRGVTVSLNGEVLPVKNFEEYIGTFFKSLSSEDNDMPTKVLYTKAGDRWEVGFALSDGTQFRQMSFVNSIATTSGGTHVNYVADKIFNYVHDRLVKANKNTKSAKLTKNQVRMHMFIFVNCKITNPSFSSQTKEQLTSKVSAFGSSCDFPESFLKKIYNDSGIVDRMNQLTESKLSKELSKQDGAKKRRITGYAKLTDANKAGTRESHKCTLILTEGDSAKTGAMAGLEIVGHDYYGVFPLRGKILNVRDASHDQIMKNAEIQALKQIIGLQHNKRYESVEGLRYGHIMVMTDQDHDGSHIKGLIINFLEASFPGLLEIPGFLVEFNTPIVKVDVMRGSEVSNTLMFFSMPEYEQWRESEGRNVSWRQKYYKGLGTSTAMEMKGYFSQLDNHEKEFLTLQSGDRERIELAFSKSRVEDRKRWLADFVPGTYLDPELRIIPIKQFIDKELILFSMADNIRSVPSMMDGFKPGQRKVMWVSFRMLNSSTKVQSLVGRVLDVAHYHHGDTSLSQTIVALAQDFVGTNNIYWLMPNGSFGSRAQGGKDASAARYIETELNKLTRTVFHKDDDALLRYVEDDETTVEPEYYVPIIPALLVNGAEGIGTGWSTSIPSFHPLDIVENIRRLMQDEALKPMVPWFRGWTGEIEAIPGSRNQYRVTGRIEEVNDRTIAITELPVKMWTQTMKEFLDRSIRGASREKGSAASKAEFIEDFTEEHSEGIRFVVQLSRDDMEKARQEGLYNVFRLINTMSTTNMVAFDPQGRLRKYETAEDILREFYHVRLGYYVKRKDHMVDVLRWELEFMSSRARFIKLIIEGGLVVSNKRKKALVQELTALKFPLFVGTSGKPVFAEGIKEESAEENEASMAVDDDEADSDAEGAAAAIADHRAQDEGKVHVVQQANYDYLLNMHIASLTYERYEKLLKQVGETEERLNKLLATSVKEIWSNDLDKFVTAYEKFTELDKKSRSNVVVGKSKGKAAGRKRKAKDASDGDDSDGNFGEKKPTRKRRATAKVAASYGTVIPPPPVEEMVVKKSTAKRASTPRVKKESTPSAPTPTEASEVPAAESVAATSQTDDVAKKTASSTAPKKPAPKKTDASKSAAKPKVEESEPVLPAETVKPRPARPRRAATPSTMVVDSSSEDDDNAGSDNSFDGGDDEDDPFEMSE